MTNMGRLLKRVPLNFNWPIKQIWKGYINPYYNPIECNNCNGSGYSKEYKELANIWYGWDNPEYIEIGNGKSFNKNAWNHNLTQEDVNALLKENRLWDFVRVPLNKKQKKNCFENGWTKKNNGYKPTANEVNEWSRQGMGHDSLNAWICIKARLKREKKPYLCSSCKGKGHFWQSYTIEKKAKEWKQSEPPKGKGYQLWEDTTEGSPISPVFKTLNKLCEWAEINATIFGSSKITKNEWRKMLIKNNVFYKEGNIIFS